MNHLRRLTDEKFGLLLSTAAFLSLVSGMLGLAQLVLMLLIVFFLFRLSWGKHFTEKTSLKRKK